MLTKEWLKFNKKREETTLVEEIRPLITNEESPQGWENDCPPPWVHLPPLGPLARPPGGGRAKGPRGGGADFSGGRAKGPSGPSADPGGGFHPWCRGVVVLCERERFLCPYLLFGALSWIFSSLSSIQCMSEEE